jgi:hypothetical protein
MGGVIRRLLGGLVVAAGVTAVLGPGVAAAQPGGYVPPGWQPAQFTGVAGTSSTYAGKVAEGIVPNGVCSQATNIVVRWGDGTTSAPTTTTYTPADGTSITARHTYAAAGDYLGRVDLDSTCTSSDGMAFPIHVTGPDGGYPLGFVVHVTGGSSSCPVGGTASVGRTAEDCPEPKQRFTKAEKKALRFAGRVAYGQAAVSGMCAAILGIAPEPTFASKLGAAICGGAAVGWGLGSAIALDLYNDPPDARFRSIADPETGGIAGVKAGGRLTHAEAGAINRYLAAIERAGHLHRALLTAIERAQGATLAGDTTWERRQMRAAAGFAADLAPLLDGLADRSRDMARALQKADVTLRVTRKRAAKFRTHIARRGLPAGVQRDFKRFDTGGASARLRLESFIGDASPKSLSGRFPRELATGRAGTAEHREAKALRSFAQHAKARPLADF